MCIIIKSIEKLHYTNKKEFIIKHFQKRKKIIEVQYDENFDTELLIFCKYLFIREKIQQVKKRNKAI